MKKLLVGLVLALPMAAQAIEINVATTNCPVGISGGTPSDDTAVCNQLQQDIATEANKNVPEVSIDKYAEGISDSTAFAMKGQGSDYADNFDIFTIKGSLGAAFKGDMDEPEQAEGIGLGAAVTVGVNLNLLPIDKIGGVELKDFDLFFSAMSYSTDQDLEDLTIEGDTSSLGMHVRWRFIEGVDIFPGNMLRWGGVQVHTGYQRNSMKIDMTQSLKDQRVETNNGNATFGDASVKFNIDSQTSSIPFEISTSIRALYVFTLYTGFGFDYNISGNTDIDLGASGTVSGDAGGAAAGYQASINANESGDGSISTTSMRAFLGLQFNIPVVRIYVHANKGLGDDQLGVNTGVKINW
jgi:hypothetical protein